MVSKDIPFDPQHLNKAQRRALEDLEDAAESMQRWDGKTPNELEDDETFLLTYRDWEDQMIRAIRVGLTDHPAVREFIRTRRGLGSSQTLRRARSGMEKGIRQFTSDDIHLRHEITTLVRDYEQQYEKRLTQSRARKLLIASNKIAKMTPQGFHKLLKKLFLLDYFPR